MNSPNTHLIGPIRRYPLGKQVVDGDYSNQADDKKRRLTKSRYALTSSLPHRTYQSSGISYSSASSSIESILLLPLLPLLPHAAAAAPAAAAVDAAAARKQNKHLFLHLINLVRPQQGTGPRPREPRSPAGRQQAAAAAAAAARALAHSSQLWRREEGREPRGRVEVHPRHRSGAELAELGDQEGVRSSVPAILDLRGAARGKGSEKCTLGWGGRRGARGRLHDLNID